MRSARNKTTPEVITYRHSPKWPPRLRGGMPGPGELNLPGALLPSADGGIAFSSSSVSETASSRPSSSCSTAWAAASSPESWAGEPLYSFMISARSSVMPTMAARVLLCGFLSIAANTCSRRPTWSSVSASCSGPADQTLARPSTKKGIARLNWAHHAGVTNREALLWAVRRGRRAPSARRRFFRSAKEDFADRRNRTEAERF